jgi:hypothetical protein
MTTLRGLLATTLVALLLDTLSRTRSTNLGLFVAAQAGWEGVGTWSTGNGMVLTGPVSRPFGVAAPRGCAASPRPLGTSRSMHEKGCSQSTSRRASAFLITIRSFTRT